MIEGLKQFTEMKESGLVWAPRLPAHWAVQRNKQFFRAVDIRSTTGAEELLNRPG